MATSVRIDNVVTSGEKLDASSPLVSPGATKPRRNPFVSSGLVGALIRKRLRTCAIEARPYDLRSSFDTSLMLAESHGLIIRDLMSTLFLTSVCCVSIQSWWWRSLNAEIAEDCGLNRCSIRTHMFNVIEHYSQMTTGQRETRASRSSDPM
ncbi:MAG: hypothetical protein ABSB29_09865 [Nitrososphaerales archaeon]